LGPRARLALALPVLFLFGCGGGEDKPAPLFGYNSDAFRAQLLTADKDADFAARGGADVQRLTFDWRYAEPAPDKYELAVYDQSYKALTARGVKPILILMFAPEWTWKGDHACTQFGQDCRFPPNPRYDSEWRQMAALLARRYPKAAGIEIWNEPNLASFWGPRPDPRRYADLLRQAHRAIKEVDPSMRVIGGSLNNVQTAAGGDMPLPEFLGTMYENGAKGAMDALSVHPYSLSATNLSLMRQTLAQARSAKDKAGDQATPMWATEIGLSTTGAPEQGGSLSEEEQSKGLVSIYEQLAKTDGVEAVIVHTLVDRGGEPTDVESGYGVVRRTDLQPKPAYCALAMKRGKGEACAG